MTEPRRPSDAGTHTETGYRFERFESGVPRFVSAVFDDLDDGREAARDLENRGYPPAEISVFMSEDVRRRYIETHPELEELDEDEFVVDRTELQKKSRALEGAGAGGAIGGAVGAVAAAVAAVGTSLVVPPLGIVVAGPVAAAFAGAGGGGAVGSLVGALTGAGMSEYRARRFEKLLKDGDVIVGVHAQTEPERVNIQEVLTKHGGDVIEEERPEE